MERIRNFLNYVKENNLYPDIKVIEGISTEPKIVINGKEVLLFCSSNYLGLANHPEVKEAVKEAINKYGIGVNGSRLVSGTLDIHRALEKSISEYKHAEEAITFPAGFMANSGAIPALVNIPELASGVGYLLENYLSLYKTVIFSDELNHASIIDGCRLAKAKRVLYKHSDVNFLERKLKHFKNRRKIIITDGIFSMDGDIAPLPEIVSLAQKYSALVMLDDAHATGILGKTGRGTLEHYGIKSGVNLQMGTFSKAFGSIGGFIVGNQELVDFLRITARTYIFSGAFPGCLAAGIIKAMEISQREPERRNKLWENYDYLITNLKRIGLNTLGTQTPIVPILIGSEKKAISIYKELFLRGIFAPCVRWPAVPKNQSRIRITLMSTHNKENLDALVSALENLGKKYGVI